MGLKTQAHVRPVFFEKSEGAGRGIAGVSCQRMTCQGRMASDLVGSACAQATAQKGMPLRSPEDGIAGFADLEMACSLGIFPSLGPAGKGKGPMSPFFWDAMDQGKVFLFHLMIFKLQAEAPKNIPVKGQEHKTTGFSINAVYRMEAEGRTLSWAGFSSLFWEQG